MRGETPGTPSDRSHGGPPSGRASGRSSAARLRRPASGSGRVEPLSLRRSCRGGAPPGPPRGARPGRAAALADADRGRRPGDRAALARPHARDSRRAGRRADRERRGRRLPARGGAATAAAASRALRGPHVEIAERLLELALGPFRGRGFVVDRRPAAATRAWPGSTPAVAEVGIAAGAASSRSSFSDEVIGALAVFGARPRPFRGGGAAPPRRALEPAGGRRPERAPPRADEAARRRSSSGRSRPSGEAARQLRGLFEISNSFARSLSLEATLEAVAATMVELLDVDAAVDPHAGRARRGARARTRSTSPTSALHGAGRGDPRAARSPLDDPLARGRSRAASPRCAAGPRSAGLHDLPRAVPGQGLDGRVIPLATPGEVLGTLTLLSLDPARPLDAGDGGGRVVGRGAGGARDRQRAPLPAAEGLHRDDAAVAPPDVRCREVAGARDRPRLRVVVAVDVGGDVYDFLALEDGRLAVVLGDVTGKGIEAAADMAMAKFVFRALAREHPEPGAFLARANEVVVEEIALGKFITMIYAVLDPKTASSLRERRPPAAAARRPDGTVTALLAPGLALGIDGDQGYEQERVRRRAGRGGRPLHGRRHRGAAGRGALRRGAARRAPRAARSARRAGLARRGRRGRRAFGGARPGGRLRRRRLACGSRPDDRNSASRVCRGGLDPGGSGAPRLRLSVVVFTAGCGHARDRDRRLAAARALLRLLDDRVGEHHRADPRLPLARLLAGRARSPTAGLSRGCSG